MSKLDKVRQLGSKCWQIRALATDSERERTVQTLENYNELLNLICQTSHMDLLVDVKREKSVISRLACAF